MIRNKETQGQREGENRLGWLLRHVALSLSLFVSVFLLPGSAQANSYSTSFPATENPISESGNWVGGSSAGGNLWGNVQTKSAMAFGVSEPTQFGDPTAILTASGWGPNQTVTGTVKIVSTPGSCCHEIELRLRFTISANKITGYEAYCSAVPGDPYCHIARWNGANGSYCNLENSPPLINVVNGDVMKATVTGTNPTVITLFRKGTQIVQATDTGQNCSPGGPAGPFTSGTPGIGFYDDQDNNWSNFGFSSFSASDGNSPPPPPPPPPTTKSCDLNSDGSTNVVDVQLCVNQALGIKSLHQWRR